MESPIRAAGLPPIKTVTDPLIITSGGPVQMQVVPITAAGNPPISTLGAPGGKTMWNGRYTRCYHRAGMHIGNSSSWRHCILVYFGLN